MAVTSNPYMLHNIPHRLRTRELCEKLVAQHGDLIEYVPDEIKTHTMCINALRSCNALWAIRFVPEELQTEEILAVAVEQNGLSLWFLSEQYRTRSVCKAAVQQDGWALQFVPEGLRDAEMCEIAVRSSGCSLRWVPADLITPQLIQLAEEYGECRKHLTCQP